MNRSINDNGKSLKEDTTEQAVVLKSGLPHDSPPKSAAGLDAYFYAFDSEIKMAPSGVSETVFDFENGLIVGLSWWGCSNADKQETDVPDEVAENSSSISVAVQTDAQRIHMSTMTDDEFPVFGYPSFRSKLFYLETKIFGFNNKVTSEMLEPHLGCMHAHNISNCYQVNKWMNPLNLWVLERKACEERRMNQNLPRA